MPKKERDPLAPKRNLSAYLLYQNAMRDSFQIENPGMDFAQLAKHTSKMYCEMPSDHKDSWRRRAEEDKKRYEEEMRNYNPPSGFDSKGNIVVDKLKKQRDPGAPKRNRSAYMLFQNSVRDTIKTDDKKMKLGELAKKTSALYSNLSIEDKAKWQEAAAQDKVRYEQAMDEYEPPVGYDEKGYILESHLFLLKKKKKPKDPAFPKRPCGSYVFFTKDERPKLKEKSPGMEFTEMGHVLGETWRNMKPEEKAPYEEKANVDKERFNKEVAEYHAKKAVKGDSCPQHAHVVDCSVHAAKQEAAVHEAQEEVQTAEAEEEQSL